MSSGLLPQNMHTMKIIVTQPMKQHVAGLLEGLAKRGWLTGFYSQFISNKLPKLPFASKFESFFRKRRYNEAVIDKHALHHEGLRFIAREIAGRITGKSVSYLDGFVKFDEWAAKKIAGADFDVCICYENANLATFKEAKRQGKVTVLDLAQIHHEDIVSYMEPVWSKEAMAYEVETVNPYKVEALAYTDYIITISDFARASMVNRGWPEEKVFNINLGINPSIFNTHSTNTRSDRRFTFLFVGSIMPRKGIEDLLAVWSDISDNIEARLVFVGPMVEGQALLNEADESYEYHPFMHHEDLATAYRDADVYVLPSLLDSWAQTVIEAMACGTAAIVSDRTGAMQAVAEGGGWIVPAQDRAALKERMLYCYNNQEVVAQTGRAAGEIAANYTWANYHRQVADVVTDIAKKENLQL